jgi:hypothetical protein
MAQEPVVTGFLRPEFSGSGIYMFSEAGKSLYIGRTRDVRKRMASTPGDRVATIVRLSPSSLLVMPRAVLKPITGQGKIPAPACCSIRNLRQPSRMPSSAFAEWSSGSCPNPTRRGNACSRSMCRSSAARPITTSTRPEQLRRWRHYVRAISSRPSFSTMSTKLRTAAGLMISLCPGV